MSTSVFELIANELELFFAPISARLRAGAVLDLMLELGWYWPEEADLDIGELIDALDSLIETLANLDDDSEHSDYLDALKAATNVGRKVAELSNGLPNPSDYSAVTEAALQVIVADSELVGKRATALLMVRYLEARLPALLGLLQLCGVIRISRVAPESSTPGFYQIEFIGENATRILDDPGGLFAELYEWGRAAPLRSAELLSSLERVALGLGLPAALKCIPLRLEEALLTAMGTSTEVVRLGRYLELPLVQIYSNDAGFGELGLRILGTPDPVQPEAGIKGLALVPFATGEASITVDITKNLKFETSGSFSSDFAFLLLPEGRTQFLDALFATGGIDLSLGSHLIHERDGPPLIIFGSADGSRFEYSSLEFGLGFSGSLTDPDLFAELNLRGASLVIRGSEGDGFLQKILPSEPIDSTFDLTVVWSSQSGLYFRGSAVLEVTIPVHKTLGPITIESVFIAIGVDGGITLTLTTTVGAQIGPISASVERIGIEIPASFHSDNSGNLGPVNMDGINFVPPIGARLVINTEAVSGGGYLKFDAPNERYDGILYLSFGEIALTAIGLITTRLPDGSKGFSMLAIIGVEFDPAYALGWGFFLKGVGGLIGIHRTMDLDAIQDGIRTGAIDSILFPSDPIANAPKIISDLRSIFPPEEGRYVIGPMVIITWGVPTIISAEIAILIEIPSPIRLAILGQLMAILPDKDEDLVQLRLDVAGLIDFGKGTLSIDATLYDSHLLSYPLEGDMALRSGSGYFAMAVGGLHPAYRPPPGFPSLRRLRVSIGKGGNPRLNLNSYFALTENTIQFGSRFELYAKMSKFKVYGVLGFDTIFYFSPFRFTADIYASVDLLLGSRSLMSVKLDFTLQGPTPWRARGKAKFKILWVKYKKSFDKTFGRSADTVIPELDPWPQFMASLEYPGNWVAVFPSGRQPPVAIKDIQLLTDADAVASGGATSPPIVIDPVGELVFKQKVVPLDVQITRFGNGRPEAPVTFDVIAEAVDLTVVDAKDQFPPGQFWDRSQSELLSVRGELHKSGLRMSGATASYVDPVAMDVKFEEKQYPEIPGQGSKVVNLDRSIGLISSAISSAAKMEQVLARLSGFGLPAFDPQVQVMELGFVIVTMENLTVVEGLNPGSTPVTRTEAEALLEEYEWLHQEILNQYQVLPVEEAVFS